MKISVLNIQNNSDMCAVCGLDNDFGLKAHFYECEGDIMVAVCKPLDEHQSYPNRMHGGLISALLDETLGRAIQINDKDIWAVTGSLEVKFRKPTPLNENIYCVAKIIRSNSRGFVASGLIEDQNGTLLATAFGNYVKAPIKVIANDFLSDHKHWFCDQNADKITQFDIHNLDFFNKEN